MPPPVALIACIGLVGYLIWKDSSRLVGVSGLVWVPTIWTMILSSRFVSQWLNIGGDVGSLGLFSEGSPIDQIAFSILILAAFGILVSRAGRGAVFFLGNRPLMLFVVYAGVSVIWSDHTLISFKRWVKEVGNLLMVMVIMTEEDPKEALGAVVRRTAYLMILLSIVFIKYYPHLGRSFSQWTGQAINVGVTTSKNMLGALCLVSASYFLWELERRWKERRTPEGRRRAWVAIAYLAMIGWIYKDLNSVTSLMCLCCGMAVFWAMGKEAVRSNLRAWTIAAMLFLSGVWAVDNLTGFIDTVIAWLGRDPTLTDRKFIWSDLLALDINRMIGCGYDSLWLTAGAIAITERWHTTITHSGYLDTYLNLGWIGIALVMMVVISAYKNILEDVSRDIDYARYKMGFLAITLLYNYTETGFKGTSLVWLTFMAISFRSAIRANG